MPDKNKLAVLQELCKYAAVDNSMQTSFSLLSNNLKLSKNQLDTVLIELENERYLTQFVIENNDSFMVKLHQKAFDILQEIKEIK